jgi:O-antigen/teichoic acid export membrane protein
MTLTNLLDKLKNKSEFFRSVVLLVTGTAFAQALMIIALPLLTRLYTPEEFNTLAIYVSLLGVISVAACLGLDMAVPLPEKDEDAVNIVALSISFACIVALLAALCFFLIDSDVFVMNGLGGVVPYLWMLPLGVLLSASYSAIQFYAVRQKKFSDISKTRMAQSIVALTTQIGFGNAGVTPFGLLLGQMLSGGSGFFYLWKRLIDKKKLSLVSFEKMKRMLFDYRRFPQFSTFEILTNSASIQFPILLIASLAAGPEAGFLILAMRVMQAPMGLVGGAIGQVYLSKAPEEHRDGNLALFTNSVICGLLKTGVGPIIFVGIIAPLAFSIVFGPQWERAGILVAWMTPWFVFQFLASPISMSMHVRNMQKVMLLITFSGFLLRVGALLYASKFAIDFLSEYYAISGGMYYFVCFFIFSASAGLTFVQILSVFWKAKIYLIVWVFAGVLFKLAISYVV